jgi:hypothetical protein
VKKKESFVIIYRKKRLFSSRRWSYPNIELQIGGAAERAAALRDITECGYVEETGFVWLKQKKKDCLRGVHPCQSKTVVDKERPAFTT